MNPRLSRSVRSTSAGLALPLLEVALSSSLMMNTRLDSPAMLNDSIIIPGLALEYILELPVSCSASLIELISRVVQGILRILATR